MTTTERNAIVSTDNRQGVITGLRDLADFLEAHSEIPAGRYMPWVYIYGPSDKHAGSALAAAADVLGEGVEVKQDKWNVDLVRNFGPVELTYRASLRDVGVERTVTQEVTETVVPALADRKVAVTA